MATDSFEWIHAHNNIRLGAIPQRHRNVTDAQYAEIIGVEPLSTSSPCSGSKVCGWADVHVGAQGVALPAPHGTFTPCFHQTAGGIQIGVLRDQYRDLQGLILRLWR